MIKSMTGFGKAELILKNFNVTIEVKTLNNKSFSPSIKIPEIYSEKETEIKNLLVKYLERGKIYLQINLERNDENKSMKIDKEVFINYYNELKKLSSEIGHDIDKEQIIQTILKLPETVKADETEFDEEDWLKISEKIEEALKNTDNFRIHEGITLKEDILINLDFIENAVPKVEPFEKERIEKTKENLRKKLSELKEVENYDENRFEQEIIYYLEKSDINEEKSRLKAHCKYFREIVDENISSGKKLGFICQEIGREINTLGSKASHSEIQKIVVGMKDSLEKIKEQVLNIL